MTFSVGSLVKARGRERVVLPDSIDDLLVLRPLGGSDDEIVGIDTPLELVTPASYDLPALTQVRDYHFAHVPRDAVGLGFRTSGRSFPSFDLVGFERRPYRPAPLRKLRKLEPVWPLEN
jgi:hypothetical protein